MKFFLYARKSTEDEDRQILSIGAQLSELRSLAEKESFTIEREFVESKTAKEPGRPIFNEMMKLIQKGEAEGIIAWHPDRLARNSVDGGLIVHLLSTGKLQALKFPTFWFENTPQGKFMLNIAFGQSQYYVDNLSENVRRGLREKLRRNEYPGWAPVGYLNDPRRHCIDVDEVKAPLIRRMFEAFATGRYTTAELHKMLADWGLLGNLGKPVALSRIPEFLSNPFYIGLFRYKGEVYEGRHQPIVPRETFDQVQKILRKRHRGSYQRQDRFPFRGLIRCEQCGAQITAEVQKGHHYYRCTKRRGPCSLKYVREEVLAEQLRQSVRLISLSEEWTSNMLAEVEKWETEETESSASMAARHQAKLAEIQSKLDRLLDVYLEGAISREEYTQRKERFIGEKTAVLASLERIQRTGLSRFEPLKNFINHAQQAGKIADTENFSDLKDFHKRLGSNLVLCAKTDARKPKTDSDILAHRGADRGGEADAKFFKNKGFFQIFVSEQQSHAAGVALQIQYPEPWGILASRSKNSNWRGVLLLVRTFFESQTP